MGCVRSNSALTCAPQLKSAAELDTLLRAAAEHADAEGGPPLRAAGGSAANVCRLVAELFAGAPADVLLLGVLGDDETGAAYRAACAAAGLSPEGLARLPGPPSAVCAVLVTPDGQRTMFTLLGAAAAQSAALVQGGARLLAGATLLHVEGYALARAGVAAAAVAAARAGCAPGCGAAVVSLDLGSTTIVRTRASELASLLAAGGVDLVLCNEEEAEAAAEALPAAGGAGGGGGAAAERGAAALLAAGASAVVVTRGGRGSSVFCGRGGGGDAPAGAVIETPAEAVPPGELGDTAGCGDAHAAGFLWALLHGRPLAGCAAAGAAAGGECARARGPQLPPAAVARLRARLGAPRLPLAAGRVRLSLLAPRGGGGGDGAQLV